MIFSQELIDTIFTNTHELLDHLVINKEDLIEEVKMFEWSMAQIKQHPWQKSSNFTLKRDLCSPLFQKIQSSFVGDDPKEDYKEVIVWHIADMLYVTASVDHNPLYPVKWDVVVFDGSSS